MQMVIKFLRRLKEGHQQFLDFNKLEIIGKKLVHARVQPQIPNGNSVRDIIIRGKKIEIIIWVILLKLLDYSLSVSMR